MPHADRELAASQGRPAGPAAQRPRTSRGHPLTPLAMAIGNQSLGRLLARQPAAPAELVCLPEEPLTLPGELVCMPGDDLTVADEEHEGPAGPQPVQAAPHVPASVSASSIAGALASVNVTVRTERATSLQPWEVFRHTPNNNKTKKALWNAYVKAVQREKKARGVLKKAEKALADAPADVKARKREALEKAVATASTKVDKATKGVAVARANIKAFVKKKLPGWSPDPQLNTLDAEVAAKARELKAAKGDARAKAKAALDDAKRRRNERIAALRKEVDDDPMTGGPVERKRYTISFGDTVVHLHDHVDAYATINAQGLEGSARRIGKSGPTVDALIDADAAISPSTKKILKLVSSFEGKFSSVNTWDIADVTWGFIQWTTGKSGRGSLIGTLQAVKKVAPKVFDERLRRYGIDVGTDAEGIILTLADGTRLTGKAAAKRIQTDPVLVAVLSAAGEDPDVKLAQLRHANDKVGKEVLRSKIKVGGRSVGLGEILTSELGVGAAFNRAVHAGAGAVRKLLQSTVDRHLAKEKIDPKTDVATWRAGAETACIAALKGVEPDRTAKMAKVLSATPGSFR